MRGTTLVPPPIRPPQAATKWPNLLWNQWHPARQVAGWHRHRMRGFAQQRPRARAPRAPLGRAMKRRVSCRPRALRTRRLGTPPGNSSVARSAARAFRKEAVDACTPGALVADPRHDRDPSCAPMRISLSLSLVLRFDISHAVHNASRAQPLCGKAPGLCPRPQRRLLS